MSKKMQGNGLWESSRMMLPEHKEKFLSTRQEIGKESKAEMDEQILEECEYVISDSLKTGCMIKVKVSDPFTDYETIGRVCCFDERVIKLETDGKIKRIVIRDIVSAERL